MAVRVVPEDRSRLPRRGWLLLLGILILAPQAWAQSPLIVRKNATDVLLSWAVSTPPYTVLRGTDPSALAAVTSVATESWTDAGVVRDGANYFYAVEDATGSRTNMGFKIERDLLGGAGMNGRTFISLPYRPSFEDLDGDTSITSADVLLDWWNGEGSLTVTPWNSTTCSTDSWQGISRNPFSGEAELYGSPYSLAGDPTDGFIVVVGDTSLASPITIVGSHDDSVVQTRISSAGCCRRLISIPYHTTWQTLDDILAAAFNGTDTLAATGSSAGVPTYRERWIVRDDLGAGPPAITGTAPWSYEPGLAVLLDVSGEAGGPTILPLPHW